MAHHCMGHTGYSPSLSPEFPAEANPEEQVTALVEKYASITLLNPIVLELLKTTEHFGLLYEVFDHYLNLIKSRSQAFEDGHITVYDKALLQLSRNGNDLHNVGALELYLDEVVGVSRGQHVENLDKLLNKHVALKTLLLHISRPESNASNNVENDCDDSKNSKSELTSNHNQKEHDITKGSVSRLLVTFVNAKHEYDAIAETDIVAKSRAVKFLRDTAENALNYLHSWKLDHHMIPELETSFAMAKEKAISLSGGRKRPFEVRDVDGGDDYRFHRRTQRYRRRRIQADCYRPS